MLLKKKSKQSVDSEWAVILERVENEFVKARAIDQLGRLFSLSNQEAKDLIDNTPIILLDHLSLDMAEKIKRRFSELNMTCSLTNDIFTKRKCFRAVWPEQPDPTRFLGTSTPSPTLVTHFEDSISKIQSATVFSENEPSVKEPSVYQMPIPYGGALSQEEEKQLKELMTDLQKENEVLKLQLNRAERSARESRPKYSEAQVDNLRTERLGLEEALGKLRAENSMLRSRAEELEKKSVEHLDFQETFGKLRAENSILKSKAEELERNLKSLKQVSEASSFERTQFTELKTQIEHVRAEYNKAQLAARRAQSEAKQFHAEWNQTQKVLSETRVELEELKRMLGEAQSGSMQLKEETDRLRSEFDRRLQAQNKELEDWKRRANDGNANAMQYKSETERLRLEFEGRFRALNAELEESKRKASEWSRSAMQVKEETDRLRLEFEGRFQTQTAELEEWKRKASDWSASYFKVLKENEFLRAHQSEELESLRVRNQQLSVQLEQAQRQNRGFVSQLEHQELIQKRMKLANELTAQEAQLKSLVQKQQTLESEIRAREEEMKKVLSEQESIEQEIVKSKQAQKYIIEQTKAKEKSKFPRPRSEGQDFPSQQGIDPLVPPIN